MSGSSSTFDVFNADIFSARRIKVAPVVCFFGYLFIIYAILHKPKAQQSEENQPQEK